jgi:hypothetical protein
MDEGHWILKAKNAKAFHDVLFTWLAEHLESPAKRSAKAP